MVKPSSRNHNRDEIVNNNLLQYIDCTNTIPRNKEIIKEYASGKSYKELSEKYGVCVKTIAGMISSYVNKVSRYCAKNGIDYKNAINVENLKGFSRVLQTKKKEDFLALFDGIEEDEELNQRRMKNLEELRY